MRKYGAQTAFLDVLFLSLLGFVALTLLELLLINPIEQNKTIEARAEFMITVSWPDDLAHDVDTWVEDPVGNVVSFKQREKGLMHLDRDDLGHRNDTIMTEYGRVEFKGNREIVTVRGIVPGEYIVNVHLYRMESQDEALVTVQLDKISPFKTVIVKMVTLVSHGEELTAFRFYVNRDGQVSNLNELPKFVAQPQLNPGFVGTPPASRPNAINPPNHDGVPNLIPDEEDE